MPNNVSWDSIEQVVDAYAAYLQKRLGNTYLAKFNRILEENREAARAEAVIFSWLHWNEFNPEINDDPKHGGADFLCHPRYGEDFVLEVTSMKPDTVVQHSGWPDDLNFSGGAFRLITETLQAKAWSKVAQVKKSPLPRVVAISSEHLGADAFLSRKGAVSLFVSDWSISSPIGGDSSDLTTDLRNAVFFGSDEDDPERIVARLTDISALLLVPILPHEIRPIGILHPQPIFPFSIFNMPTVPLLRLKVWPIVEGSIETEWTYPDYLPWRYRRVII